MSSVRRIICLANSWKNGERCIAGIDLDAKKWVRPIYDADPSYAADGRVPKSVRIVDGQEPALMEIIEIPLAETGSDFGIECENLSILPGRWTYLDRAYPTMLFEFCRRQPLVLHTAQKWVSPNHLKSLPSVQRRSLQLVHTTDFSIAKNDTGPGWRGTFSANGMTLSDVKITDPVFSDALDEGHVPVPTCLLTMSLSLPFVSKADEPPKCWKLIAGVVELL